MSGQARTIRGQGTKPPQYDGLIVDVFEVEKQVWPTTGIREDNTIEDYDWRYLYLYPDGRSPEFRRKWWWFVEDKGGKRAKVPVNDEMLDALMRYRRFLGLDDLPSEDDASPIFRSIKGTSGVSDNMIHWLVKEIVKGAADTLEGESPNDARKLRRTSCHWFRHTAVTRSDDSGIGIKYVQASARHEKLETTAIYQHAEDHKRHGEWQRLQVVRGFYPVLPDTSKKPDNGQKECLCRREGNIALSSSEGPWSRPVNRV